MNISCYIADDERHAIDVLEHYVGQSSELSLVGTSTSAEAALTDIEALQPALTFLDVDMPRINGLEIAKQIKDLTTVVLTTSYREFGPEAYELGVADYLLKPISFQRFSLCLDRLRETLQPPPEGPDAWLIKSAMDNQFVQVALGNILYIRGALNYVEIYLPGQRLLTYLTMSEVIEKLPVADFSRIHKSYIVRHGAMLAMTAVMVTLTDGTTLPVGRTFRNAFRQKMSAQILTSSRLGG